MTGTQAVDRAATLLVLVLDADGPVAFRELADVTGLAPSTTSRLLGALERNGLLRRENTGDFTAGPVFSRYAARHDPDAELARLAAPVVEAVARRTGESVHLTIPKGREAVQILQVDSRYLLSARDWSTVRVPPHCSAQGKVLQAAGVLTLPEEPLEQPTPHSVRDLDQLTAELDRVQSRGWSFAHDELEVGLTAVAAPVCDDGRVVAALGISGPTARIEPEMDGTIAVLLEEAARLGRRISRHTETPDGLPRRSRTPTSASR